MVKNDCADIPLALNKSLRKYDVFETTRRVIQIKFTSYVVLLFYYPLVLAYNGAI